MNAGKIWIMNHYAHGTFFAKAGRHFWFAQNLRQKGYQPAIFCASTRHNSDQYIKIKDSQLLIDSSDQIPYIFVKTTRYSKNGFFRVMNMINFYRHLFTATQKYAAAYGKPDYILASSVHPLTLVAGIRIAKKFDIPCICEVRDLWPESIVAYGSLKRDSLLAKVLYLGEKWIYQKADALIMTWEGGRQYLLDQGWETAIDLGKVFHISNGVELESFDKNSEMNKIDDSDLTDHAFQNIIYAGSIRKVNNVGLLLDAAKIIQAQNYGRIRFLIYGSGNEDENLKKRCMDEGIHNVVFKGRVEKQFIPYVLKNAYANILHNSSTSLDKYGQSQNKFFEYLAAGKCVIQTYTSGYSICERYECGISALVQNAEEIANVVVETCSDEAENRRMGQNARKAAHDFDFTKLTDQLIKVIETL